MAEIITAKDGRSCQYDEQKLSELRDKIRKEGFISDRRFSHTLGVEVECKALAELFGFSKNDSLRLCASGLLHDITKEKSTEEQIALCDRFGIVYPADAVCSPKVFHGWTAAALARELYPQFCDEEMCTAIASHTTGRSGMTLFDSLLYLADYIEPGRRFEDCIRLRHFFYKGAEKASGDIAALCVHLRETLILSFDMTVKCLLEERQEIFSETVAARNVLIRGECAFIGE